MLGLSLTEEQKLKLGIKINRKYKIMKQTQEVPRVKLKDYEVCDYPRDWMLKYGGREVYMFCKDILDEQQVSSLLKIKADLLAKENLEVMKKKQKEHNELHKKNLLG